MPQKAQEKTSGLTVKTFAEYHFANGEIVERSLGRAIGDADATIDKARTRAPEGAVGFRLLTAVTTSDRGRPSIVGNRHLRARYRSL